MAARRLENKLVIPAQAGIQCGGSPKCGGSLDSRLRGNDRRPSSGSLSLAAFFRLRGEWRRLLPERRVLVIKGDRLLHGLALSPKIVRDGLAETTVRQLMRRKRWDRPIAARQFVLALRARLDALEPA